jgi:hypothetical protein
MPELEETAESLARKARMRERRRLLLALIHQILSGDVDSTQEPIDRLYQMDTSFRDMIQAGPDSLLNGPRPHYISPEERSSYNSGYMWIGEMGAGTPNTWE